MKFTIRDLFWAVFVAALIVYSATTTIRMYEAQPALVMLHSNLEVAMTKRDKAERLRSNVSNRAFSYSMQTMSGRLT